MKRSGIALGALIAFSVPSLAADLGWSNPAAPSPIYSGSSVSSWGGFYAGINGGYAWGNTANSPALPGGTVNNNSNGWMLGGQAGYNMDMGGFVLGAEADLQWANIGYSEPAGALGTFSSKIDLLSTGRLRAGIPVGPVMPYATLGGAFGRGTTSVDNGVLSSTASNHFGWTAGVGLEAQATPNLSFKAEYLYVDLGRQPYNGLPVGDRDVGHRFSVVRAGVNYKF